MEHVVFFPSPDGAPAFARVGTLEEAVRLVEHLRNSEGVAEVSVHPLGAEVPLAFRAYYRVEVPAVAADVQGEPEPVAVAEAPQLEAPQIEPVVVPAQPESVDVEPVAEAAPEAVAEPEPEVGSVPVLVDAGASNGHAGDGAKSLGFFA